MHPVMSVTATQWLAGVVPSFPTLVSQERKQVNEKYDGE